MNYQERVSTRADVRALFEKVKANPEIAKYRGYTDSKSYGWNPEADEYIKAEGEVWFDNPQYDESLAPQEEISADAEELIEESGTPVEEIDEVEVEAEEGILAELSQLREELSSALQRRMAAEEKCDTVCRILMGLKEALEAVLAYEAK